MIRALNLHPLRPSGQEARASGLTQSKLHAAQNAQAQPRIHLKLLVGGNPAHSRSRASCLPCHILQSCCRYTGLPDITATLQQNDEPGATGPNPTIPRDRSFASASKKTSASPVARHRCNRPEACYDTSRHVGHILTCGLLCKGSNSLASAMAGLCVGHTLRVFRLDRAGACPAS